jgi:hypothetical protein
LGDERGRKGNKGTRGEAVESGEDNDGDRAVGGEPEGENNDSCEGVDYDHGVEAADAVCDNARQDTTENT